MTQPCDNLSVGVIIEQNDKIALLKRAKSPIAMAPPAGHIDDHGSPEQAAVDEVFEEIGLSITSDGLVPTVISNRRVNNQCRRVNGDHHTWWVYRATKFEGTIAPCADETQGANWYTKKELQAFADRTRSLVAANSTQADWQENPGLEETWLAFFIELGYIK